MKVSTVESVLDQFDTFHVFLKKRNSPEQRTLSSR
jgi:hypothetical protein